MSPDRPTPTSPTRRWTWPAIVACIVLLFVAFAVAVVLTKACPPVPAPAGKPVPAVDTTGGTKTPVPGDSKDGTK